MPRPGTWRTAPRPVSCRTTCELWRFEQYYRLSADQLPRVLCREALDAGALRFPRWQHAGAVTGARIWLFRLPSGQVVAALSRGRAAASWATRSTCSRTATSATCRSAETPVEQYAHALAVRLGADGGAERGFLPERHQIVFGATPGARGLRGPGPAADLPG